MLRVIDLHWVEHLTAMQNLREGIGLHAYGQRDPLVMYKKEAHEMFGNMHMAIQRDIVRSVFHSNSIANAGTSSPDTNAIANNAKFRRNSANAAPRTYNNMTPDSGYQSQSRVEKVSRNTKCPCGSGKKYKRCHGVLA